MRESRSLGDEVYEMYRQLLGIIRDLAGGGVKDVTHSTGHDHFQLRRRRSEFSGAAESDTATSSRDEDDFGG